MPLTTDYDPVEVSKQVLLSEPGALTYVLTAPTKYEAQRRGKNYYRLVLLRAGSMVDTVKIYDYHVGAAARVLWVKRRESVNGKDLPCAQS